MSSGISLQKLQAVPPAATSNWMFAEAGEHAGSE